MLPVFCPLDMVAVPNADVCIEARPWPGYEGEAPLFGLSALPEAYLRSDGTTWDAESLCASRGRRLCTAWEWSSACEGSRQLPLAPYRVPSWNLVTRRDAVELLRLLQWPDEDGLHACSSPSGTIGQLEAEEWVRVGNGYAISAAYWSRAGDCRSFIRTHAPNWHDYATTVRCCLDA